MSRIFLLLLSSLSLFSQGLAETTPPNIVFFFADDLGYGDLGCYGHPYARTPNLDRLAEEGTRFTQAYVTGVTCNPSRTGLMTGLHPARFQRYAADFGFGDRVTISELLKRQGYRTGHFGKWHIGPDSTEVDGMYGLDVVQVIGKSKGEDAGRDDDLTTAAIAFMKENAAKQPIYVNIWGHSTHFPVTVPPSLAGEFEEIEVDREDFAKTMQHKFDECQEIGGDLDESMRQYLGDVWSIDRNVERVLAAIDELGIRDNTIFVFSSDHGPAPVILGKKGAREFSNNMLGYAGIHRGGKHTFFEGGTRVPFLLRWPGKIPEGHVDSESVISFIDWMPTIASIAGIEELPRKMDGEDVSEIWFGQGRERANPLFWQVSSQGASGVMRQGKWKFHEAGKRGENQLYDLSTDPSEKKNLANDHPEVVAELKEKLDAWQAELPKSYEKRKNASKREKKVK
ncbi:MAG: sulfatase-like hydrolase/transferase [Verrucomicrobiales bacterium]|nr:sulfatase-like hydrolase/transferase [Verrucomicrobiales bacterium]